jgi:ribosomal 50S subunit-recycling heat shock protein
MEHVVGPEAAGERLDVFLAPHVGSRAAAQKLIDAGLVLVDGEARAKRHAVSAGERITVEAAPEVPEVEVPDAQFAASSCIRRAATVAGHSRRRWRAASPAAIPAARASCTGSTATRPGCWWSPAASRSTPR